MSEFDRPPIRRLVLVGSVIADLMATVPQLPPRGGDVLAGPIAVQPGGGFNVLAAAARLGLPGALAGRVGRGPMGTVVRAALADLDIPILLDDNEIRACEDDVDGGRGRGGQEAGRGGTGDWIAARGVVAGGLDTGACLGFVEPDGERTFVTSPGIEATLTPTDLAGLALRADDACYVSGYELLYPASGPAIAGWAAARPAVSALAFDPGPLAADLPTDLLESVLAATTLLTLNARELHLLGSDPDTLLARCAPGAVVVARDGARGATVHRANRPAMRCPAPAVIAVDTTGAGDAHTGALLAGLAAGLDLAESTRRATVAAALSVTRAGSATGPTTAELDAALAATPAGPVSSPGTGSS